MNGVGKDARYLVPIWGLAVVGFLFFLRAAASLLIPIVLAFLISYALEPIVAWLARHRLPRSAGTSVLMISLLGLAGWGAYSLRDEAVQTIESLPAVAARARELVMAQVGSRAGSSIRDAADEVSGQGEGQSPGTSQRDSPEPPLQAGTVADLSGLIRRSVQSVFALAGYLMVIVFLVFFLLLSGHHIRSRLIEIAGPDAERRRTMTTIVNDINSQIQRFLLVRLATATVVGALTWAALAWLGVQNAAIWGILAGVFNSIPYFGPIIVSGGLFLVGLAQGGGSTLALQMSGAALVITSLEGWLITPPLLGKTEQMSALAVFLGLLLWTWVWGAWGTLVAVPMLVIVKSVADRLPGLKPLGRLMAP